jgi:RNA polymerase sigma-70 factor (ECF subfamily)
VEGRPRDADEARLIEAARGGDQRAYEELVRMHTAAVYRAAYIVAGSAADAEDAAQDAFVKAWRALSRFRRGAPFRPWILRIAVNEARNRRRSAGRRAHLALRAATEASSGGAAPSPEELLSSRERRGALLAAVESLGDDARDVIACRYLLGLSEAETAEVLSVPPGTVKSRVSRALERLRSAYD